MAEFKAGHPHIKMGRGSINLKETDEIPLPALQEVITQCMKEDSPKKRRLKTINDSTEKRPSFGELWQSVSPQAPLLTMRSLKLALMGAKVGRWPCPARRFGVFLVIHSLRKPSIPTICRFGRCVL